MNYEGGDARGTFDSILDTVRSILTPGLISRLSGIMRESPDAVATGARIAVPELLNAMADKVVDGDGAAMVAALLREGRFGESMPIGDAARLEADVQAGMSAPETMLSAPPLIATLLGDRLDGVTSAVKRGATLSDRAVAALLGALAPLLMSVLGRKLLAAGSVSPVAVAEVLRREGEHGPGSGLPAPRAKGRGERLGWIWPAAAVVALGVGAGWVMRSDTQESADDVAREAAPQMTTPVVVTPMNPNSVTTAPLDETFAGGAPMTGVEPEFGAVGGRDEVPAASATSSAGELEDRLTSPGAPSLPREIVFEELTFVPGTAQPANDALRAIEELAATLIRHPSVVIRIEGHTDGVGDPVDNQALSAARAEMVRSMLIERGIDGDRMSAAGLGDERPMAATDTTEGRARNGRIEVVVMEADPVVP